MVKSDNVKDTSAEWGSYALPLDMSGLWKALQINLSDSGYFNPLFQWDDAWLITVLRQDIALLNGEQYDFEDSVRQSIESVAVKYGFKDCMVVFKSPKANNPVLIYSYNQFENRDELIELTEVSTIIAALEQERELFPLFFVYTSGKDIVDNRNLKRDIGTAIAEKLWQLIEKL